MMKQRDTLCAAPGMFFFVEKWLLVNFTDFREKEILESLGFICCFEQRNVIIIFDGWL